VHQGELPFPRPEERIRAGRRAAGRHSAPTRSKSRKEFSDKYSFDFPLLSDPDRTVAEIFGVKRGGGLVPVKRNTFCHRHRPQGHRRDQERVEHAEAPLTAPSRSCASVRPSKPPFRTGLTPARASHAAAPEEPHATAPWGSQPRRVGWRLRTGSEADEKHESATYTPRPWRLRPAFGRDRHHLGDRGLRRAGELAAHVTTAALRQPAVRDGTQRAEPGPSNVRGRPHSAKIFARKLKGSIYAQPRVVNRDRHRHHREDWGLTASTPPRARCNGNGHFGIAGPGGDESAAANLAPTLGSTSSRVVDPSTKHAGTSRRGSRKGNAKRRRPRTTTHDAGHLGHHQARRRPASP